MATTTTGGGGGGGGGCGGGGGGVVPMVIPCVHHLCQEAKHLCGGGTTWNRVVVEISHWQHCVGRLECLFDGKELSSLGVFSDLGVFCRLNLPQNLLLQRLLDLLDLRFLQLLHWMQNDG